MSNDQLVLDGTLKTYFVIDDEKIAGNITALHNVSYAIFRRLATKSLREIGKPIKAL